MKPQRALIAALAKPPEGATGLVVAFSGGRDSTALLHALSRQRDSNRPLRAIHVCHHLQPQAEAWARHCAGQCAAWEIAFTRVDIDVGDTAQGIEAAARHARYAAIADTLRAGEVLVTAHHAQDQAETFLLQALRGAGVEGLAGMPVHADFADAGHWRPWLGVSRGAIEAYARQHGLEWIADPSNADPDIDRGYLRTRVLPALAERWPAFETTLARSASHAATAAQSIRAQAIADLAVIGEDDHALRCSSLVALPVPRANEVIRHWLADAGLDRPDHRHVAQIGALARARLAQSPGVHFAATDVRRHRDRLFCMPALAPAPKPTVALEWDPARPLCLPHECGTLTASQPSRNAPTLRVTFRQGGERIVAAGGQRQRLKERLRSAGIVPWIRERTPLVYYGDELIVVPNFWRHPRINRWLGVSLGPIRWHHRLVGGPVAERVG